MLRNGEVPIILRITIASQRAELNINRTVNPDMWIATKGMSRGKSRADIELNRYLETVRTKLLAIHTQMVAEGTLINPDTMKKLFLGVDEQAKYGWSLKLSARTTRNTASSVQMNFRLDDTSFEKSKITATIAHTGGNIAQAAKIKSPMEKEGKVWTEIMYHFLGGILQCWWYDYCSSVLFILLLRWYICISVVYFVSLR